jgi:membrane protein YqaA with SNARE-associated domain
MGIMDSSFLFLPFGNDLLVVALVARHHQGYLLYVLAAAFGSTLGVLLLDLMSRKLGEEGVQKIAGQRRFAYLKKKIGQHGFIAIVVGCLAPPPFPFTVVIAILCALGYPRTRLLLGVAMARAGRFLILGFLAIKFGRTILHIINSSQFKWTMVGFIAICTVGSVLSLMKWFSRGRRHRPAAAAA